MDTLAGESANKTPLIDLVTSQQVTVNTTEGSPSNIPYIM